MIIYKVFEYIEFKSLSVIFVYGKDNKKYWGLFNSIWLYFIRIF